MSNLCKQCAKEFEITDRDLRFYDRISPVFKDKKCDILPPTFCPDCRRRRRLAHWPFGILQKRKCDFSGESIISTYPPDVRFPVYKRKYWFSDKWDLPEMDVDINRPFFDQFYELQCRTPHFHQLGKNNTNCDYADDVWDCKNGYMSRSMLGDEDVYYVYRVVGSKNCMDLTYCFNLEQCYECTYCFKGFNLRFCLNCRECIDSYFLYDCRGCSNCFMCWNLRNKQYHILNKKYSKEDYAKKITEFGLNSRENLGKKSKKWQSHVCNDAFHRSTFNVNTQSSTGNYITNCKNCYDCYFLEEGEDCAYVMRGLGDKDCMDVSGLLRGELCYGVCQSTDMHHSVGAYYSVDCHDCFYIDQCLNCKNCFGCVGLRRKEYCILNKQYSKEEYEELVPRIIDSMGEEWGEFFPYKIAYNRFNLSLGAFYYGEKEKEPESDAEGFDANEFPDLSEDISDDLIGKPIKCTETGRIYAFVKQELDFYRRHNLPLPICYPEERNKRRFFQLVPLNPRKVKCFECGCEAMTYYPEKWGYKKILCEKCYLKEVY